MSLADLYLEQKLSIPQIADMLDAPRSRIRQRLLREGVTLRSKADGVRLRSNHLSDLKMGKKRGEMPASVRQKISASRLVWGKENARGTRITTNGYIEHTRGPNKGRLAHDIIMEERLGRRLRDDEIVHHIDDDEQNNADDNLSLMTRSGHSRHHRIMEMLVGIERKRDNGRFS